MADGSYRFQQGAGQFFYPQHNQQSHFPRHLQQRASSPVSNAARAGFNTDATSPSRSPGPQSPAQNQYGMFSQNHQQQNQHGMINGGSAHNRFNMGMGLKHFQQGHQNQNHQQHQDHGNGHGPSYGNHQHNVSSGGLSNAPQHFGNNHLQNGTPGSTHSGLSKHHSEHWQEQLALCQRAREMTMSHSHARNHPSVNKQVMAGTTNGFAKDSDRDERNRSIVQTAEEEEKQVWTALDFGGQSLKVISSALFDYSFLTKLYVNHNKLTYIPAKIGQCRHLTILDFSLNELRSLPPEMGMLTSLTQLLLFDNKLESLPMELGSLFQLEMLGIEGNNLLDENYFNIIMDAGTKELITWFRENADVPDPPCERDWIVLDDTSIPAEDKFTVLNYNTLCDKYATQQQYGFAPTRALAWEHRKELLLDELRARNADIMGLQEMDAESYNDYFRPNLASNDYKGVFHQKGRARTMGGQDAKSVDGCATFFKNKKYILLDKATINFAQIAINRPDMKGEHDIFNRVMPRDDVALIVFLENRMTGTRLIVANSHHYWNPLYEDVKVVQVAILLDELSKLADKWSKHPPCVDKKVFSFADADADDDVEETQEVPQEPAPSKSYADKTEIPIIMCGDYNSGPESPVYELVSQGSLSPSHRNLVDHKYGDFTKTGISHPFSLRSSYANINELSFTNYTASFTGILDYIWYSTNALQVTGLLGDVDKEYLKRVPGFPNYHFPSDHLALVSEFVVKGKKKAAVEADFGNQGSRRS
ncbi:glucose-repressible alcohol dehydrogenase-like protein transcriptional effector [Pseudovirgaria hyperparasitica]|uniref:CCR4-Not complex 3'-5'-exoribonuclease subunit Ccr4 n=1 Tax=Pseudovirgaria hyperparasitica TaxID=470096 RepID=A0A6A6W961_9PEZI|nr:glucose-repressible alcohol dehydrogenase-like protein transcriptional effector [Pseudovirgaria hyperparasitica]KAF2758127.1 glucose-repressible alcohol dehydrogenase-like protein transcriptional effector [Pseudovirgaria hyperparasitica]